MVLWASTNGRCLIDEIYDVCGTNQQYIVDPKGKQISSHETIMWSGRWRVAKRRRILQPELSFTQTHQRRWRWQAWCDWRVDEHLLYALHRRLPLSTVRIAHGGGPLTARILWKACRLARNVFIYVKLLVNIPQTIRCYLYYMFSTVDPKWSMHIND